MILLLEILLVLALVLLNGFLAMSELAVMSSRRARLEQMAIRGEPGAKAALKLVDDPTHFLSTVQVGITLVGILAGAVSGATLSRHLAEPLARVGLSVTTADTVALAVVVLLITYLSLIIGEIVPKRLALAAPERTAARVARPMAGIARVAAPVVWLLRLSTNAVLRLLGVAGEPGQRVSEEEIRALLAEGAQAGVLKRVEREMIEGVMRVADRPLRSLMTPRPDVVWLDVAAGPEAIRDVISRSGHSRYPVCRGDLDEILGVLHVRKLAAHLLASEPIDLVALAEPPFMVHEGATVVRAVELFRQNPIHMAVLLDEYGVVEGIVTPVDILSAIAGDLAEEDGSDQGEAVQRPDGSWLVDAGMGVHEVERLLDVAGMTEGGDFVTLAGFVLWRLGRMAKVGDEVVWQRWRFVVVDLDGRRIDKIMIQPQPAAG